MLSFEISRLVDKIFSYFRYWRMYGSQNEIGHNGVLNIQGCEFELEKIFPELDKKCLSSLKWNLKIKNSRPEIFFVGHTR